MSGLIRRISSVIGAFLLLIVLLPPGVAVADTGAERAHSSLIEEAFGWLAAVGGSFLSDDLGAGPDPWGRLQAPPPGELERSDLGAGPDPDGVSR